MVEGAFGIDAGIDVRYYFEPEGLRYDFIVHPEARVEDIKFTLEGADDVWLNGKDEIVMLTSLGEVRHKGLLAYQEIDGKKTKVPGKFHQNKNGEIGFRVHRKDDTQPLIIDPLIASTFLGRNITDQAYSLELDSESNVYVTGQTNSANFPTTPGAYDETFNNKRDVFVSVLNSDLSDLLYSTFLGGEEKYLALSLALDNDDNVYVAGKTESEFFPTTPGAYDVTCNLGGDVFVSALSPDLSELLYSTYLGGSPWWEIGNSLTFDSEGNVYLTGETRSGNFPATPGAYNVTHNGGDWDAFVSAFSPDLSQLLYSIFLGGNHDDHGYSIVPDSEDNVYLTGMTRSVNFPTTPEAFYTSFNNWKDVFVSVFSSDLSQLLYSTFLGGDGSDYGYSLDFDSAGNVYLTGKTGSQDFPTTPGAYNETYNGSPADVFISIMNPNLSGLLYSTFFGGSHSEEARSLAFDNEGNLFLTGWTYSDDFPVTLGAYDQNHKYIDVFISKFSSGFLPTYTLTIVANPEEGGIVEGGGAYIEGEEVEISAIANEGWQFINWTGDTENVDYPEQATANVTMPAQDIMLKAQFEFIDAVKDISGIEIKVFPNPSRNMFTIEANVMINHILLIDINGQVIKNVTADAPKTEINVENIRSGVYFIQIHTASNILTKKVHIVR